MMKYRIGALIVLLIGAGIGYFVYSSETAADSQFKFKYGLDLNGGSQLVYRADVTGVPEGDIDKSMDVLRQTIEKRVNVFGVSEPVVRTETGSSFADEKDKYRLVVELPGVTDLNQAVAEIGQTPLLEFRLLREDIDITQLQAQLEAASSTPEVASQIILSAYQDPVLTGGNLKRANLVFDPTSRQPLVSIEFNDEGSKLFEQITGDNIGKELAIFLDGQLISNPIIQQGISGGIAQINGDFTAVEARDLVNNLNFGALPLPIELLNTQTVEASLGQQTLMLGAQALLVSLAAVSLFMVLFYRLPGVVSVAALVFYSVTMLAVFKLIPVVLTAAGIAGLILSIGMAVDANVLIFERIKEELDKGKLLVDAIKDGFDRAWSSIWDGNITGIIAGAILYWTTDVALVKGFALVLVIGIIVSMLSAITVSKTLLLGISKGKLGAAGRFLYSKGITNIKR
jgi:preprotein translocase subunit SecD